MAVGNQLVCGHQIQETDFLVAGQAVITEAMFTIVWAIKMGRDGQAAASWLQVFLANEVSVQEVGTAVTFIEITTPQG